MSDLHSASMDITLKQLQIFRAVVVAGSITKASGRVGLSQPTISQQLAKLEALLGSQLISRGRPGTVSLTTSGEFWFKVSDDMLRRLEEAVSEHERRFVDNQVVLRIGVSPTLRGRFIAAAARIAGLEPGFAKFEVSYALTSSELVEHLRLHQLNCIIVNQEALAEDRSSFTTAFLFDDPLVWMVPESVPPEEVERAIGRPVDVESMHPALARYVEISVNVPFGAITEDWYRAHLPFATARYSATTYHAAADLVAEGIATSHSPLSLLPSLPLTLRNRLRIYALPDIYRTIVLAMPKHLLTLPGYANIFRNLTDFCRNEYRSNIAADVLHPLPGTTPPLLEPLVIAAE